MPPDHIVWNWKSQAVRVGVDRLGVGPTVLLLPALSSISTRREMRPLQERLASNFTTVAVDWPGFGSGTAARRSTGDPALTLLLFATSSPRQCLDQTQPWLLGTRPAMPSPLALLLRTAPAPCV